MTLEQSTDQRFAWISEHGGPVVNWVESSGSRFLVEGEGLSDWHASYRDVSNRPSSLHKHAEVANGLLMLALRLARHAEPGADPVQWESNLKVGEHRYVRSQGSAADFPTALSQVDKHVHETRQFGGLTWWSESQDRWVSWLGASSLAVTKINGAGSDAPYWHFEVRGDAPTLEEAALLATLGRSTVLAQGT